MAFQPNIAVAAAFPVALPVQLGGTVDALFGGPQALLLEVLPDAMSDCTVGLACWDEAAGAWAAHAVPAVAVPHGTAIVQQRYVTLGRVGYYAPYLASGAGTPTAMLGASRQ